MPRATVGSTTWVFNKFLRTQTKLRWVCGLCDVWCKDENGFKCHLQHENHIRRSRLARERPTSRDFDATERDVAFATRFVTFVAQNYLNQTVLLHDIYREMYPQDAKKQLLIKSTCWGTLGVFVNALAKAGEIEAHRDVKGWMVRVQQDRLLAAENIADRWRPGAAPLDDGADEASADEEPSLLAKGSCPEVPVPLTRATRLSNSWEEMKRKPQKLWPQATDRNEPSAKQRKLCADIGTTFLPDGRTSHETTEDHPTSTSATKRTSDALVRFSFSALKAGASFNTGAAAFSSSSSSSAGGAAAPSSLKAASRAASSSSAALPSSAAEVRPSATASLAHSSSAASSSGTAPPQESKKRKLELPCSAEPPPSSSSLTLNFRCSKDEGRLPFLPPGLVVKVRGPVTSPVLKIPFKAVTLDDQPEKDISVGGSTLGPSKVKVKPINRCGKRPDDQDLVSVLFPARDSVETVIPKIGGKVLLLSGKHAGSRATLTSVEPAGFCCCVALLSSGQEVKHIRYDDLCKLYNQE